MASDIIGAAVIEAQEELTDLVARLIYYGNVDPGDVADVIGVALGLVLRERGIATDT